ncbi:MAG: hypothetical protein GF341_07455 [candidate division Zixibacteria bacterium]|nr:hypothetical protein [candidate division Zixibacteria bacterium]
MIRTVIQITMSVVVLVAVLGCDDDGPVEPGDVRYNIYIAALDWVDGNATDPLYIIDADSMVVIDSIPRIGSLHDMEVSPDGRWLYTFVHRGSVSGCPNDSLRRIDIKNKRVDWAIPSGLDTRIQLLDGGSKILRRWSRHSICPAGEELLDATTGELLRVLPDSLLYQEGPINGTEVAAIIGDPLGARIVAVDVETDVIRGRIVPKLPSGQKLFPSFAELHPDGETVLAIAGLTTDLAWGMVGNLRTGEWLLTERIYDVNSAGTISTDGALALISDMNSGLSVFELDSLIYRGRVSIPGGQVEFVGDTKSAIMCGRGDYFHATHPVVRVDVNQLEPTHAVELPLPSPLLGAMTVGRRP